MAIWKQIFAGGVKIMRVNSKPNIAVFFFLINRNFVYRLEKVKYKQMQRLEGIQEVENKSRNTKDCYQPLGQT